MSILEANKLGRCHTRVARRDRLLVFSLHHNDEEDSAFVPAAEPAHSPIIDTIAERHRLAKPKEFGLNVHGYSRPDTSMARLGRTVNSAFRESPEATLPHANQHSASPCPDSSWFDLLRLTIASFSGQAIGALGRFEVLGRLLSCNFGLFITERYSA
jgi:hypothetical protein